MDRNCCQKPDVKIISGIYTCINCGVVHQSCLVHEWVIINHYNPRKVVFRKSVYNRTYHVKQKLQDLRLTVNEMQRFLEVWTIVENHLKRCNSQTFPKIDFFNR